LNSAETFHYLNQSGCTQIEDVDDAADFSIVSRAIDVIGASPTDKEALFRVLAGILHLGNVAFFLDERKAFEFDSSFRFHLLQLPCAIWRSHI
jgi:myosin-5